MESKHAELLQQESVRFLKAACCLCDQVNMKISDSLTQSFLVSVSLLVSFLDSESLTGQHWCGFPTCEATMSGSMEFRT